MTPELVLQSLLSSEAAGVAGTDKELMALFGRESTLGRFRARGGGRHGAGPLQLTGRGVRPALEEQMHEMAAWAGAMANDLERAGAQLAGAREQVRLAEGRRAALEKTVRFLEWQCSQRHVREIEAEVERLQTELQAATEADLQAELQRVEEARGAASASSMQRCEAELEELRQRADKAADEAQLARAHARQDAVRRLNASELQWAAEERAEQAEQKAAELAATIAQLQVECQRERERADKAEATAASLRN